MHEYRNTYMHIICIQAYIHTYILHARAYKYTHMHTYHMHAYCMVCTIDVKNVSKKVKNIKKRYKTVRNKKR